jgi:hypothetical protein
MEDVDVTILVAKAPRGNAMFAHVVPQTGVDMEHYAVDVLMKDLKWLGCQKISLRSDNEKAILKLLEHAVTEARLEIPKVDQIIQEHPNTYDSAGNGEVEVAVKTVTGLLRTNKIDLEKRIGTAVPQSHPLFSWLVGYCAWIHNIRTKGADGLTAYQRVRSRDFKKRLVPFGELVFVHLPIKGPERREGGALDPRAVEGLLIGYGTDSHSYIVYVNGDVNQYRSIYRMPLSRRWSAEKLERMHVSRQAAHDGRGARAVPFTQHEPAEAVEEPTRRRHARRLELRQGELDPDKEGFWWTEHCPKCDKARTCGWK